MNKKIILTIGILLLLGISGCSGSGIFGKKNREKNPITDVDIRKGKTGLEISFIPNAPPERVFAESIFPISLKLKNSGASDIKEGFIAFGLENAFVDLDNESKKQLDPTNQNLKFNISGKSVYNPQGDQDFKQLNALTKRIGPQSETHTSAIFATACYPYNTTFGTSVCIDTDIIGERKGQKACAIKDLAFNEGQGAPVAVTKVETRMLPQTNGKITPSFMIYVENTGGGEVINVSKVDKACTSQSLNYKDFNTLKVNAYLSGIPLDCRMSQNASSPDLADYGLVEIRLKEKEDVFRCTLKKGGGIDTSINAYTASLKIELVYGYTFTISKDIIIQKVLTY